MTGFVPDIERNGYKGQAVAQFLREAPRAHVSRFRRDCAGKGPFVIWDPNDDEDGFMLAGMSVAELNAAFLEHFEGYLV